jgi:RND family efflux transporter MFP subunit
LESQIDAKLLNELRIGNDQREDDGSGKTPRWPWFVAGGVLIAALAAGGGWWALSQRPVAVQTAAVAATGGAATAGAVLQATGYVTARRQATVSTQITGTLTRVLIEAGDTVKAGQVIARLDDTALRATLNAAQAGVAAAQAQAAQAQAQLTQAQADARRQNELLTTGMISRQAAEQARTAAATAAAGLEARRREVDAARAQLEQAKVNYDFTFVRAPFAGVVTEKAAQVGEIVSPLSAGGGFTRTGVGTIVDMDSLEVDVDVNEAYIGQVSPGMPAEAVLDAYPDWRIPAHVIAIIPAADRGKATVKVRVALEQKDGRIVPNMGVRVSFLKNKAAAPTQALPGVLVPAAAVAQRDGRSVVFVVADGKAQQRAVTAAPHPGAADMRRVPQGLSSGETVVLSPPASLKDGDRVQTAQGADAARK